MSTGHDSERTSVPALDGSRGTGTDAGTSGAGGNVAVPGPPFSEEGTSAASTSGPGLVFDDPLDRVSADDTDRGWGGSPADSTDDDFTRFLNEKPPHHL